MLMRLYEPILWRSLKVANPNVRRNAALMFIDVFPMQNGKESQVFNLKIQVEISG